eukprot:765963-Hanusia_phi.AAC.2
MELKYGRVPHPTLDGSLPYPLSWGTFSVWVAFFPGNHPPSYFKGSCGAMEGCSEPLLLAGGTKFRNEGWGTGEQI